MPTHRLAILVTDEELGSIIDDIEKDPESFGIPDNPRVIEDFRMFKAAPNLGGVWAIAPGNTMMSIIVGAHEGGGNA